METPLGKEYAGPSGIGRDSTWLTAQDLIEGTDAAAEIEKVILYPEVTFQGGRKRVNLLGLKFVGKTRVLGLNATNTKVLDKMFGNVSAKWKGQKITLFVSETQMAGESVKCVRIRDRGSRVANAAEQFLGGGDDEPKATKAVKPAGIELPDSWTEEQCDRFSEACSAVGITPPVQRELIARHAGAFDAVWSELGKLADKGRAA